MTVKILFVFQAYTPNDGNKFLKVCAESKQAAEKYLQDNGYFGIKYCGENSFILVDDTVK